MKRTSGWTTLAFDSWTLAWEASTVIGLRLAKLGAMDAGAMAEAQRMVAEKMDVANILTLKAMTGGLGATPQQATRATLAHYRKAVARNRRRLGASSSAKR
ncbi:MAG TPA: hypothetical protein VF503_32545 [Sphingobium sp.]|uniref:hypothetical protein n=1 Tax=Sphingobium sp. TaxID=1912891 RepID=UPI002ED55D3F